MITQQREQRDRYDELERLLLRGEYMTTGEMKEFAKLWRRKVATWRFTATVIGVARATVQSLIDESPAAQPQVDESFLGEGVCGFFDRPVKP